MPELLPGRPCASASALHGSTVQPEGCAGLRIGAVFRPACGSTGGAKRRGPISEAKPELV
jgi:hypothetical protein